MKQLRTATRRLALAQQEKALATEGMRTVDVDGWDDWDDGATGSSLELAFDPRSRR